MERSAIERIEELGNAGLLNETTDIPAICLPGGNRIESLEHLFNAPFRQRVHFRTERLPDFAAYVLAEQGDATAVFVRPDGSGATAVIDFGDDLSPCWKDHKATLTMQRTAEYLAMLGITSKPVSQRELTDWLEDWQHLVTPHTGIVGRDEEQRISTAIAAIRKVEIKAGKQATHEDGDFRASRTSLEQIEATSGAGMLPNRFAFRCRMYPHTAERTFAVRLALLTGHEKPQFQLRVVALEQHTQEVAEEIELEILQRLRVGGNDLRVFVGNAD